ncbi:MAG: repeat containing protein [Bacillales bacterium]|jgi:DNA-binding beta-propeller fold protein YncE|nr:repeat containing protein [Bacillales bacterium]
MKSNKVILIVTVFILIVLSIGFGSQLFYEKNKTKEKKVELKFSRILGTISDGISKPMDIVEYDQKVYITDATTKVVHVFSSEGKKLYEFDGNDGKKRFEFPYGITIHKKSVYVADMSQNRILIFDADGKYLKDFIVKGTENLIGPGPIRIANEKLYVSYLGNGKVVVFDLKDGKELEITPSKNEKFGAVNGLAIDKEEGNIFISDSTKRQVSLFDKNGKFVKVVAGIGSEIKLSYPRGLAFSEQKLFIVDATNNAIVLTDSKGNLISKYTKIGRNDGEFRLPSGIYITRDQKVLVTDTLNNRVQELY